MTQDIEAPSPPTPAFFSSRHGWCFQATVVLEISIPKSTLYFARLENSTRCGQREFNFGTTQVDCLPTTPFKLRASDMYARKPYQITR